MPRSEPSCCLPRSPSPSAACSHWLRSPKEPPYELREIHGAVLIGQCPVVTIRKQDNMTASSPGYSLHDRGRVSIFSPSLPNGESAFFDARHGENATPADCRRESSIPVGQMEPQRHTA